MRLQIEAKRSITICAGISQTGKSTFGIRYLLNAPNLKYRFIFDPEGEYCQRLKVRGAASGYDLDKQLCTGWVIFDPHILFPGDMEGALSFFCEYAFLKSERLPGRKVLGIDEVWRYCSPHGIPKALSYINQTGRRRGLGLLLNTQEPTKLHGSLLNQVSEFVCFRLQFKEHLKLVRERGFDPERVQRLPDLHFISRTEAGGELSGEIKF